MRINQYIALATGMSRRAADKCIEAGQVKVNDRLAAIGEEVDATSLVTLEDKILKLQKTQTIILNKPVGFVCSREGQGSKTVYDLLPTELHALKPVGRLDKDSSGLLLLTNDGELANRLTHPRNQKQKTYEIKLDKELRDQVKSAIEQGVELSDGLSKLRISGAGKQWTITMSEGRNRQIRRTFEALGYTVTALHRISFGSYRLGNLEPGQWLYNPVKDIN